MAGKLIIFSAPSGSGKSTLLRCLNKLEEPTGGEIIIDDAVVTDKKTNINKVRENIGMVFQSFNLFSNFTVLQNIMFAPVELKKMTKAAAKTKAMELLSRVGLADKADAYPHHIYTTGATLDACSDVLTIAGAVQVYFAAVCIGRGF